MSRVLNDVSKRFDIADAGVLDFQGVPFTLSCWVKPTALGTQNVFIGGLNADVAFNGWEFGIGQSLDKLGLYTDNGGWANFSIGPSTGSWQHVAGVQTVSDRIGYIDWNGATGKQTIALGPPTDGAARDKSIGARHNGSDSAEASVAEVAIWNKVQPDSVIQQLAEGKSALFFPDGLVFYAKLDELSGNPVDSGPLALAISEVGSVTSDTHPVIIYPSSGTPLHPTYYIWPKIGVSANHPWGHSLLQQEGVYPMIRFIVSQPAASVSVPPNTFSILNGGSLPTFGIATAYDNGGVTGDDGFIDWDNSTVAVNAKAAAIRMVQWIQYYQAGFSSINRVFDSYSIMPQNWAFEADTRHDALFRNAGDVLSIVTHSGNITDSNFDFTDEGLFAANGISEVKTWSDEFISILDIEITALGLPIPTKFHFDMEQTPVVGNSIEVATPASLLSEEEIGWWESSISDLRSATEAISGADTLDDLIFFAKTIDGATNPTDALDLITTGNVFTVNANHNFLRWLNGTRNKVTDYAIRKAFFETAKATWPNIQWSNWESHLSQPTLKTDLPEVNNASPGVNFVGAGIDKLYGTEYNVSILNADYQTVNIYPLSSNAIANNATNSGPQNWMDRYGVTKTSDWEADYTKYYHSSVKTMLRVMNNTDPNKPIAIWVQDTSFTRTNLVEIDTEYTEVSSPPTYTTKRSDIETLGSFAVLLGATTDFALWTGVDSVVSFDDWNSLVLTINSVWDAKYGISSVISNLPVSIKRFPLGGNDIKLFLDENTELNKVGVSVTTTFTTISSNYLFIGGNPVTLFTNVLGQFALGVYIIEAANNLFNPGSFTQSVDSYVYKGARFSFINDSSGNNFWHVCRSASSDDVFSTTTWNGIPLSLDINDAMMVVSVSGDIQDTRNGYIGGIPFVFVQVANRWYIAASTLGCNI